MSFADKLNLNIVSPYMNRFSKCSSRLSLCNKNRSNFLFRAVACMLHFPPNTSSKCNRLNSKYTLKILKLGFTELYPVFCGNHIIPTKMLFIGKGGTLVSCESTHSNYKVQGDSNLCYNF
jgi:hypothetical protein